MALGPDHRPAGVTPPPSFGAARILSADPPVFLTGIPYDDYLGIARPFAQRYGNTDAAFIVFPTWTIERAGFPEAMYHRYLLHTQRFPNHRFRFICNTLRETELLQAQGLPAHFLNKNFTVSDQIFRPLPGADVDLDAIYNARFVAGKRHELATLIPRVGYLAYVDREAQSLAEFDAIHAATMAANPAHVMLNPMSEGRPVAMLAPAVNIAMSRAAVGLVLSEVEGSSYCSMEYMLAGLPVVSTPSTGGRDVYFDPEFCLVCPPDPVAVRAAVAELKARQIPRDHIRAKTLARIEPARARLLGLADELLGELGAAPRLAGKPWPFGEWTGIAWGPYAKHLEAFERLQRSILAHRLGLDPSLLSGVQLTGAELEPIVYAISSRPGCRLLVFGCGNDSPFWEAINTGGTTVFLEDNPQWAASTRAALRSAPVHLVTYGTRLDQWQELLDAPSRLELTLPQEVAGKRWDVILVDGPAGHEPSSPGRMKPIFAASRLVAPGGTVFVHDSERPAEAAFIAKYLAEHRLIAKVRGRALLLGFGF